MNLKSTIIASVAALALAGGTISADAAGMHMGGGGGFHGGGGGGGFHGGGGHGGGGGHR
jgi:hypothetical protein